MTSAIGASEKTTPIDLMFEKNRVEGVYSFYEYYGRSMYDDLKRFILENQKSEDRKTMSDVNLARSFLWSYRDFKDAVPLSRKKVLFLIIRIRIKGIHSVNSLFHFDY